MIYDRECLNNIYRVLLNCVLINLVKQKKGIKRPATSIKISFLCRQLISLPVPTAESIVSCKQFYLNL